MDPDSLSLSLLSLVTPAWASDEYVEGQLIVQFKEGVLDVPDTDATEFSLDEVDFAEPSDYEVLRVSGVERLQILAPSWRNTDDRAYVDLNGNVVTGLVDFKNVYLIRLSDSTDTQRAQEFVRRSDLVEYATVDAKLSLYDQCHPNDPLYPQQWGLHNDGSFGGGTAVEDVDVNFPEAFCIQDVNAKKIAILDTGIETGHLDLRDELDRTLE
jgi:hypothetical protein